MTVPEPWEYGGKFTREHSYAALTGVKGLYVIAGRETEEGYDYEEGTNRILYVGSGDIGARLTMHSGPSPGNEWIAEELDSKVKLEFCFMLTPRLQQVGREGCEGDLIEEFIARYGLADNGLSPYANTQQPAEKGSRELPDEAYQIIDFYEDTSD